MSGSDTLSTAIEHGTQDEFVQWCRSHDYDQKRLAASHHVSPAMTGYEELDSYGQWAAVPTYGEVWSPRSVPANWAPYREGRWVWIEPWGWNWVDDEPWGFAPFHYGRWARVDDRWAWVPGEYAPSRFTRQLWSLLFRRRKQGCPCQSQSTPEAAARQQAQRRAAAEAVARQQAAQQAQQRAAAAAHQQHAEACGHPGQPPCPK